MIDMDVSDADHRLIWMWVMLMIKMEVSRTDGWDGCEWCWWSKWLWVMLMIIVHILFSSECVFSCSCISRQDARRTTKKESVCLCLAVLDVDHVRRAYPKGVMSVASPREDSNMCGLSRSWHWSWFWNLILDAHRCVWPGDSKAGAQRFDRDVKDIASKQAIQIRARDLPCVQTSAHQFERDVN